MAEFSIYHSFLVFSLLYVQICAVLSDDDFKYLKDSANYLRALFILIVLKYAHDSYNTKYQYLCRYFTLRFQNTFYIHVNANFDEIDKLLF